MYRYYSATLFKEIGFNQPTAVGLIVSGTNFLFTLFALKYIDTIGRRKIMIFSAPGMVIGLTLASISFYCESINYITEEGSLKLSAPTDLTKSTGHTLVDGAQYSTAWSAIVLVSMIFYVASYATGLGNVPWQQGELFSLESKPFYPSLPPSHNFLSHNLLISTVRGIGTSLATFCNWAGNLLIGSTYLSLMDRITPAGAFGFYAGLCLLGCVFVACCFPETAGLSLEEVQMVFRTGFGVRESERLRREKRDVLRKAQEGGSEKA